MISDDKTYLGVAAADGVVLFDELQLSGKKRMAVADFLRGFHNPCSYTTSAGTSRGIIAAIHDSERQ